MLFQLLFAAFVLPSVLSGCCLPRKIKATLFRNTEKVLLDFLIDFDEGKFTLRPHDGSYTSVVDFNKGLVYKIWKNGTCIDVGRYFSVSNQIYNRCLRGYTKKASGVTQGLTVDTYISEEILHVKQSITVNRANCQPVAHVMKTPMFNSGHLWMDVSTTNVDTSGLNVDTTHCRDQRS